eukprot:UN05458
MMKNSALVQSIVLDDIMDEMQHDEILKKFSTSAIVLDDIDNIKNVSDESHDSDNDVVLEMNNVIVTAGGPILIHDEDDDMAVMDGLKLLDFDTLR